jgi:hypothetical protein
MKKTRGRKSRATVPLTKPILAEYFIQSPGCL